MELFRKSAAELSAMQANGECSAVEIAESVFSRIDAVEDKVGAYITLTKERALAQAADVDRRRAAGEELAPLAGIPVAVKDNISTKGVLTTCASKMLHNYTPPFNATIVDKLQAAGTVMPGKLNMDEFAMGSSTETSHFHLTKNPHDLASVPGGSSGGSAASVAAGEAVLSLGSDTGGSIRLPAAFCGVVGMKPTYGAVSRYGLVAFGSSLDQIGPFARTVKDTAMLMNLLCGYDRMDATSAKREYPDFAASLHTEMKGKIIGIPKEYFGDGVSPESKESVMQALRLLVQQGAVLKEISLPSTDYALSVYYVISSAEASSNLARFDGVKYGFRAEGYTSLTDMYEKTRSEGFGDEVKRRIMLGTFVLSSGYYDAYYGKAKLVQKRIEREFAEAFEGCDVIATPTGAGGAFKLGAHHDDPIKMYATDICTVPVNIAGLPAISVPCGKDASGLPLGLQLIGAKWSEQKLLDTAYAYECLRGGPDAIPAIG